MSFVGRDTEIAKKELAIRGRSGKRALTSGPLDYSPLLLSPHPSHPLSFSFSLHLSNCPTSSSLSSLSLSFSLSPTSVLPLLFFSPKSISYVWRKRDVEKFSFLATWTKTRRVPARTTSPRSLNVALPPPAGVLGSREEPPPTYTVFFFLFFFLFFTGTSTTTTTTVTTTAAAARPPPPTPATGASSTSPSRETRSSGRRPSLPENAEDFSIPRSSGSTDRWKNDLANVCEIAGAARENRRKDKRK